MLLASGSHDGTVRLWNPDAVDSLNTAAHSRRVTAMTAVPLPGGQILLPLPAMTALSDSGIRPPAGHTVSRYVATPAR